MTGDTMTPDPWMTPEPGLMSGATMVEYGSEGLCDGVLCEGEERSWECGGEQRGEARLAVL